MLEQLQQSLEPILETHGLWLALGLLLLVLVPTLVLFFLRIQQRQGVNTQLQDLLDASGVLYSRLSALDHGLHQYQTQAEGYTGKTQIQVQPLLAPLSENLAQLHRCKVQIKEWEADLADEEAETAQAEWQSIEHEAQALIAATEKTESFFKRLKEVEMALQNQLKQIDALLTPYQDSLDSQGSLASLKKRLAFLESGASASDPLTDLEGIRQLLQDANLWIEAEKKARLALEAAQQAQAAQEAQAVEKEAVPTPIQPQVPVVAESRAAEPIIEAEHIAEPEPIAEPAPVGLATEAEALTPVEAPSETHPKAHLEAEIVPQTDVVTIDQVLDQALEESTPPITPTPAEVVPAEMVEMPTESPATTVESTSEPEPAAEPIPEQTPETAPETTPTATEKIKEARAKIEARLQRETAILSQQQARFLPDLEEIQHSLTTRFVAALWESSEKHLKRAFYKAQEAELLLKLAQRLHHEPAAPTHRVLLNLQRASDKWPEVEKLHLQLQTQYQELTLAAEQTLQDCRKLLALLALAEFENKKNSEDYLQAQNRLAGVLTQFESARALDLAAVQMDLAWVAHCIQSWKTPSNPEEESMVAL